MSSFRIPRRAVEARLLLEGGGEVTGRLFAPRHGPHGEPGTIEDRLSDSREPFLPVVRGDRTIFVSADWILAATIARDDAEIHRDEEAQRFDVTLHLAGGVEIRGAIHAAMPAEESRLLDFLNTAPRFVAVETDLAVVLVNRDFVVSVVESD